MSEDLGFQALEGYLVLFQVPLTSSVELNVLVPPVALLMDPLTH